MSRTLASLWKYFVLSSALCGCLPKIGDDCITDQDCSQQLDRLCDTTQQPGGYCTIADCDPTICPEKESVCVSFNISRSSQGACANPSQPSPHRRNFCMALCDNSKDCRGGYACTDLSKENIWSAAVISEPAKKGREVGHKVCMLAESHPDIEEDRADDFCRLSEGGASSDD